MSNLLIICKVQFGYHTDIYKWCEYLRDDYKITVLTLNDGREKVTLDGVRNIYVPNAWTRTFRGALFILFSLAHLLFFKGLVIICYFNECILFKRVFPWKRMLLDIRTLDVSVDAKQREKNDDILKRCVEKYDFVTCISKGVREKIGIPNNKSAILPLGADSVCVGNKKFDSPYLLYVGTLYNRHVEKTIDGFAMALNQLGKDYDVEYEIIGTGLGDEFEILKARVAQYGLEERVHLRGYVRHDKLSPFFEKCNVGISFVPLTDYYECQPPTKTFEYALSGMYVIATATDSNKEIINANNGCLIQDTADAFCKAIVGLSEINPDSSIIRESVAAFRWERIINEVMKPILLNYQNT